MAELGPTCLLFSLTSCHLLHLAQCPFMPPGPSSLESLHLLSSLAESTRKPSSGFPLLLLAQGFLPTHPPGWATLHKALFSLQYSFSTGDNSIFVYLTSASPRRYKLPGRQIQCQAYSGLFQHSPQLLTPHLTHNKHSRHICFNKMVSTTCKGLFTCIFSNSHIMVLTSLFRLRKQKLRQGSQLSRVTLPVSSRTRILTQVHKTPPQHCSQPQPFGGQGQGGWHWGRSET